MAYIKDSPTTDIATTLSEPSFVGGQSSIQDYPFQQRGFGLVMAQLASSSPFYSGDYSETNLFESLIPIELLLGAGGGGGFGGGGSSYSRFARPILLRKDDHYIPTPAAVGLENPPADFQDDQLVEFNSDNYFQLNPTEVVELNSDVTITSGGTGYPFGVFTNVATTGGTGVGLTVDIQVAGAGGVTVISATVNNEGFGYTHGDTIKIIHPTDPSHDKANRASLTLNRDTFTVIMRNLTNTKLTLKYGNVDQFVFVEGTNLGDEPSSATAQTVSNIRWLKNRADIDFNIDTLTISNAGSGFTPNQGISNVVPTGGTGTGLIVNLVTHSTQDKIISTVIVSEGQGYSNGDILNVPGGNNDATLTVVTDRFGHIADITVQNGEVTGLSVVTTADTASGSDPLGTGDLLEATLSNGGKVKFRYLKGITEYHNFIAAIMVQINTAAGHGFEVGDYMVVAHDNPAFQVLGTPGFSSSKKDKGEYTWVDEDAVYFFHRNVSHQDWASGFVTTPVNDRSKLVSGVSDGPAALSATDKINENQMGITGSFNTIAQRLNPKFKAVKMTCASAWNLQENGKTTAIGANVEHIFRYFGENDGLFKANTQGGGSATLNWQYFVG